MLRKPILHGMGNNYVSFVLHLLKQLIGAINITQKCIKLTRNIFISYVIIPTEKRLEINTLRRD